MNIPFNKPYLTGDETDFIATAVEAGKLSGNGYFTERCQGFFEKRYGIKKALLTNSCTAALEMAAILLNVSEGDEVIMPSYTFVSTSNAFVLRGAKIVFCDSQPGYPNIDESKIVQLISEKTKAIVVVHYGGISCNMDAIMQIAEEHKLFVVEDAAQAVEGTYTDSAGNKKALGTIGNLATFSFHETKNVISGEGGLLAINDERFIERAEIIWEKGTNRSAFFRGEVSKYEWVDIGSSFLPSEVTAAFLAAQLQAIDVIQEKRKQIWKRYYDQLSNISDKFSTPILPNYSNNNAHLFYLLFKNKKDRSEAIEHLKKHNILAVFHYVSLHSSAYFTTKHRHEALPNCDRFSDCLLRLPFYNDLSIQEQQFVIDTIKEIV